MKKEIDSLEASQEVFDIITHNIRENVYVPIDRIINAVINAHKSYVEDIYDFYAKFLFYNQKLVLDDNKIIDDFNKEFDKYLKTEKWMDPYIVGLYAEYKFYEYLKDTIPTFQDIVWVSRYIGDGFGFDFLVYNKIHSSVKLYEVKGSLFESNYKNRLYLTPNETNIYKQTIQKNIVHHKAKVIVDKNHKHIYDIKTDNRRDKLEYIIGKDYDGFERNDNELTTNFVLTRK